MGLIIPSASRIVRAVNDPFFPETEYENMSKAMSGAWQTQISVASRQALALARRHHGRPDTSEIAHLLSAFRSNVSGYALTRHFGSAVSDSTASAYHRGKREVNAERYSETKSVTKYELPIQVVDGMSEAEAIAQLSKQVILAGGQFWDTNLQDSLAEQMKGWFEGELTREDLVAKLKELIETRLEAEDRSTLGDNYFQQLAHHSIVRTRTVSKYARAKELGAKGYLLINPMDLRTSRICRKLVEAKRVYLLHEAQSVVDDLLSSTTTADLKAKQPFWASPDEDRIPVPPLHWGECRTTIRIIFLLKSLILLQKWQKMTAKKGE